MKENNEKLCTKENKEKLLIIGGSGHGKVVCDIALKSGYQNIEFFDDDVSKKECAGFSIAGSTELAKSMKCDKFIAIGNGKIRENLQKDFEAVTLIHPQAVISRRVAIGDGSVVMAGAVINSDTKIGKGCIVNTGATVDHDCGIGDFTHVSVGAHIAGSVSVGRHCEIGAGATVINNISICDDVILGAGAVVVKDITVAGTYAGVPARRINSV